MVFWWVVFSFAVLGITLGRAIAAERRSWHDPMYPVTGPRVAACQDPPPALKTGWRFVVGTGKRATTIEYPGMDESAALAQFMKDKYDYAKITVSEKMP